MAYASGTRTVPGSAQGDDAVALIESLLSAHSSWTFIEEYVGANYKHRVWRCNAAGNDFGADFFLLLSTRPAASPASLWVQVAEGWNSGTKQIIRPCPVSQSQAPAADYSVGNGTGYSPEMSQGYCLVTLPTSGTYDYFVIVSRNYFRFGYKYGAIDRGVQAGHLFDNAYPGTQYPPLSQSCNETMNGVSTSWGQMATTRHPYVTTSISGNFQFFFQRSELNYASNRPNRQDLFWQKAVAGRAMVASTAGSPETQGHFLGTMKDCAFFAAAPSGGSPRTLDTVTIDGDLYVCGGFVYGGSIGLHWFKTVVA